MVDGRKQSASQLLTKQDKALSDLITPADVDKFERSEAACTAVKIIGRLADSDVLDELPTLTQTEYCTMRDYLFAEIAIGNANRSGELANMLLKEFESVRFVDERYVVSVASHKTSSLYGPAKIVLSPQLYSYVCIYVKFARHQVVRMASYGGSNRKPDELFLGWFGERLLSGQITRAVQSIWAKAEMANKFTFNLMRKSATARAAYRMV